jgi:hypothetical protein
VHNQVMRILIHRLVAIVVVLACAQGDREITGGQLETMKSNAFVNAASYFR